jgi:putative ABC transport system permease protein
MALGAGSGRVLAMVLKEGMLLALIGSILGLAGAYGVGKAMHSIFYKVGTIDFAVFSAVEATLLLAALLACLIPARRATLVEPMAALREE